jgi:2-oxoisovalerate dehydrogenase E1 component alpha subunit
MWRPGRGYGIPGVVVDGADVLACYAASKAAVDRARSGGGPTLIEAKVTRLTAHSSDDQQTKYRSDEELAAERERDALPRFRAQLVEAGVLTDAAEARLTEEIRAAVEDATEFAESQPDPTPESGAWWVYAGDGPPDWVPPWREDAVGVTGAGGPTGALGADSPGHEGAR